MEPHPFRLQQLYRRLPFGTSAYTIWLGMILLAVIPYIFRKLRPLWRVVGSIGPFFLALDADAGDHCSVYLIKIAIVLVMDALMLYLFFDTDGFKVQSSSSDATIVVIAILFIASCVTTFIGHKLRNRIPVARSTPVFVCNELVPVDPCVSGTPYADFDAKTIRTPLMPVDLRGAWEPDGHGGRRLLKPMEVCTRVLRTCFVTQYIMSCIYKSPRNHIFVFSRVTWYRTRVFLLLATLTGLCDVGNGLFRTNGTSGDVASKAILWLTLPSITVPALLRIRFGSHAALSVLLKGFLPVESDREIWLRIGVGPCDLYCALTNAVPAERVLRDTIGLINGTGTSNVKVLNPRLARRASQDSLLRVGDYYVRIFDGMPFHMMFTPDTFQKFHADRSVFLGKNKLAVIDGSAEQSPDTEYDVENPKNDSDWSCEWGTLGGVLQVSKQSWDDGGNDRDPLTGRSKPLVQIPGLRHLRRRVGSADDRERLLRLLGTAFGDEEFSSTEEYERLRENVKTDKSYDGGDERFLLRLVAGAFVKGELRTDQFRRLVAFVECRAKVFRIPFKRRRGNSSELLRSEGENDSGHFPDEVALAKGNASDASSLTTSEE